MISYLTAELGSVCAHQIGSKAEDEGVRLSDEPLQIASNPLKETIIKYFFDSFKDPEFYSFSFSNDALDLNPVYNFADAIFQQPNDLQEHSISIAQYLYDQSNHPNIKSGDLLVGFVKDVLIEDEVVDALAIFKSESKDDFLQLNNEGNNYEINHIKGINIEKLDKGCLIFNTEKDTGFKICVIDHSNKQKEAVYWKSDFLNVKPRSDNYHATANYIQMTKSFVKERLQPIHEIDKAEEASILNRSKEFFKHQDDFDQVLYEENVFKNEVHRDAFQEYQLDYQEEKGIPLPERFEISEEAVKKKSQVFKSILKLDKNFSIYIHGNKDMIEKGTDTDGKKYYKFYYESEK